MDAGEMDPMLDHGKGEEPIDDSQDKNYCCCSDRICIGFAWGLFIILLIIFIIALCFKY